MKNPDFVKVADAYGIKGRKVTRREELDGAIREMLLRWCLPLEVVGNQGDGLSHGSRGGEYNEHFIGQFTMSKTLYTITVFSENRVGVLNQITTIFTRRQLNIETLSVSPSTIEGIHKFTITTFADDEVVMKKLVRLIDKRVDILKAYYNTDEDLVHQELVCTSSPRRKS